MTSAQLVARFLEAGHSLSALLLPAMAGTPVRNGRPWAWPNLERFTVRECLELDIGTRKKDGTMTVRPALFRSAIALKALTESSATPFRGEAQLAQELPELLQAVRDLFRPVADRPCWEFCIRAPNAQGLLRPFDAPIGGRTASMHTSDGVLHAAVKRHPVPGFDAGALIQEVSVWLAPFPGEPASFVLEATAIKPGDLFPGAGSVWGLATSGSLGLHAADILMSIQTWHGDASLQLAEAGATGLLHLRRLEVSAPNRGNQLAKRLMPSVARLLAQHFEVAPSGVSMAARPLQFDPVWVEKAPAQVRLRYQDACEALQVMFSAWDWHRWFPEVTNPVLFTPYDRRAFGGGESQGELLTQLMTPLWRAKDKR